MGSRTEPLWGVWTFCGRKLDTFFIIGSSFACNFAHERSAYAKKSVSRLATLTDAGRGCTLPFILLQDPPS